MTKHEPAFPLQGDGNWTQDSKGLTKYEEVAARFMAAIIGREAKICSYSAVAAFEYTDSFFAELEKRGAK